MRDFEEILDEVKLYGNEKTVDGIVPNPPMQAIDTDYETVSLWNETDLRNDIIKGVALLGATGICAYFSLMAAALYIPVGIGCMCYTAYKIGVYRGRTE